MPNNYVDFEDFSKPVHATIVYESLDLRTYSNQVYNIPFTEVVLSDFPYQLPGAE
jgi:hypothetical protein